MHPVTRTLYLPSRRRVYGLLAAAALIAGTLMAPQPAVAATVRLSPNGDVANAWQVSPGGAAWAAVDDPINQPDPVPATDGIWAGAADRVVHLGMTTTTLGFEFVRSAHLWYYANTGATTQLKVEVIWRGAVRGTSTVAAGQGFSWRQLPVLPSRQADIDDLRLRFTAVGGADTNLRAAYVTLQTAPLIEVLDWEASTDRTLPQTAPPGYNRQYCCNEYSADETQTPVRAGSHAARFELRRGDGPKVPDGLGHRAELTQKSADSVEVERWYGFSIYLPTSSWQPDHSAEILTQWHHTGLSNSPPLSVGTHNGRWEVALFGAALTSPILQAAPYATDAWTDWVVHVRWSAGNGFIEAWRNGQRIQFVDPADNTIKDRLTGRTQYTNDPGIYTKFGIYKWDWNFPDRQTVVTQRAIGYDELRIGGPDASYNAVAP